VWFFLVEFMPKIDHFLTYSIFTHNAMASLDEDLSSDGEGPLIEEKVKTVTDSEGYEPIGSFADGHLFARTPDGKLVRYCPPELRDMNKKAYWQLSPKEREQFHIAYWHNTPILQYMKHTTPLAPSAEAKAIPSPETVAPTLPKPKPQPLHAFVSESHGKRDSDKKETRRRKRRKNNKKKGAQVRQQRRLDRVVKEDRSLAKYVVQGDCTGDIYSCPCNICQYEMQREEEYYRYYDYDYDLGWYCPPSPPSPCYSDYYPDYCSCCGSEHWW
jgi:hypothetical protein